jgi:hypothetical protein
MPIFTSNTTGNVELRLTAYHDCDDVALFWRVLVDGEKDAAIPGVLGFMIERQRLRQDGSWTGRRRGPAHPALDDLAFPDL